MIFDTWHVNPKFIERIKRLVTVFAIIVFLVHLTLIIGNNIWDDLPSIISANGKNYLSALFTPFSIILFFEVFLLITTIPKSMSRAIARQYEIISLIVIWRVFKDASKFDGVDQLSQQTDVLTQIGLDMVAGIILFILVTLFYITLKQRGKECEADQKENRIEFIKLKKIITIGLSIVLVIFFSHYFITWVGEINNGVYHNFFDYQQRFFLDLFTAMIFTDILLVLFSYLFIDDFQIIFRNAAFIISTIFIRFSLTAERPFDLVFAISALAFGVIINLVYNLYTGIRLKKS